MLLLYQVCMGHPEFDAELENQTRASPWRVIYIYVLTIYIFIYRIVEKYVQPTTFQSVYVQTAAHQHLGPITSLPLPGTLSLGLPGNLHRLARTDGRQNMPPAVKLKQPSPRQADPLANCPELGTVLQVNGPEQIAKQTNGKCLPDAQVPVLPLGLGVEAGLEAVKHVLAPEQHAQQGRHKGKDLVDDLGKGKIEGRKGEVHDGEGDGDLAGAGGRLVGSERGMQQGPGQAEHGELVDELEGLAQGGVEEERADAEDEQGDGHEVPFWAEEGARTVASRGVHGPQGVVDYRFTVSKL